MLIYLIRHGETVFNAEQRYQGSLDVPLSEAGKASLRPAEFSPSAVYTSHLCRTKETAARIFPHVPQIAVKDLREMSFGDYEGRSRAELEGDEAHALWLASGFTGTCPNREESHEQFVARTCAAFSTLVDEALERGEEPLVIVAHGGTQMAVLSTFVGGERRYGEWLTENAGGYVLSTDHWKTEQRLTVVKRVAYSK